MIIPIPAIDVLNNKAVRLYQGDYQQQTDYGSWTSLIYKIYTQGVRRLHLVNLDGARAGNLILTELGDICFKCPELNIQYGGGIRRKEQVDQLIGYGVSRIVIGSLLFEAPDVCREIMQTYGKAIVPAIDINNGKIVSHGWLKEQENSIPEFLDYLKSNGVERVLVTSVKRDGTMEGPDIELYKSMPKTLKIIASGGVRNLQDVADLNEIDQVDEVVLGKSWLSGAINIEDILIQYPNLSLAETC